MPKIMASDRTWSYGQKNVLPTTGVTITLRESGHGYTVEALVGTIWDPDSSIATRVELTALMVLSPFMRSDKVVISAHMVLWGTE